MRSFKASSSSSGLYSLSPANSALISSNRKLLENGDFSDVTIVCGQQQFKVHQFILCPRSPFFATALQGSFLEGHTKTIELPDDDPTTVYRMLQFLYTLQYTITEPGSDPKVDSVDGDHEQWKSCLQSHCAIYILADKLDIPDLKYYSLGLFKTTVYQENRWNLQSFLEVTKTSLSMLPTSDSGLGPELLSICAGHIGKHPETLDSLSGGLSFGQKLGNGTNDKMVDLRPMADRWRDLLKENPLFTMALLTRIVQHVGNLQRSHDSLEKKYEMLKAGNEKQEIRAPPANTSIFASGRGPPPLPSIFGSSNVRPNSTPFGG